MSNCKNCDKKASPATLKKYNGAYCKKCFDELNTDDTRKACAECKLFYKESTFKKYNGTHCGVCYGTLKGSELSKDPAKKEEPKKAPSPRVKEVKSDGKKACVGCKNSYAESTFKKYDGVHCGTCYKKLHPDKSSESKGKASESDESSDEEEDKEPATERKGSPRKGSSCEKCEKEFKQSTLDKYGGKHCGKCIKLLNPTTITTRTASKTLKIQLWDRDFGKEGTAKCPVCGVIEITQLTFEAGRIIAGSKGGKYELSNVRAICKTCNQSMGEENMEDFMKKYPKANKSVVFTEEEKLAMLKMFAKMSLGQ